MHNNKVFMTENVKDSFDWSEIIQCEFYVINSLCFEEGTFLSDYSRKLNALSANLDDITVLLITTWNSSNKWTVPKNSTAGPTKNIFLLNMAMFDLELAWALLSAFFISRAVNLSIAWTLYQGRVKVSKISSALISAGNMNNKIVLGANTRKLKLWILEHTCLG